MLALLDRWFTSSVLLLLTAGGGGGGGGGGGRGGAGGTNHNRREVSLMVNFPLHSWCGDSKRHRLLGKEPWCPVWSSEQFREVRQVSRPGHFHQPRSNDHQNGRVVHLPLHHLHGRTRPLAPQPERLCPPGRTRAQIHSRGRLPPQTGTDERFPWHTRRRVPLISVQLVVLVSFSNWRHAQMVRGSGGPGGEDVGSNGWRESTIRWRFCHQAAVETIQGRPLRPVHPPGAFSDRSGRRSRESTVECDPNCSWDQRWRWVEESLAEGWGVENLPTERSGSRGGVFGRWVDVRGSISAALSTRSSCMWPDYQYGRTPLFWSRTGHQKYFKLAGFRNNRVGM